MVWGYQIDGKYAFIHMDPRSCDLQCVKSSFMTVYECWMLNYNKSNKVILLTNVANFHFSVSETNHALNANYSLKRENDEKREKYKR